MLLNQSHIKGFVLAGTLLAGAMAVQAQTDTTRENKIDSLLLRQKGVLGTIAQTLMANNSDEKEKDLQRSDIPFQRYRNRVIRNITIQPVDFGFLIGDTAKRFSNSLTRVANGVHYTTRNFVLRNNLFFHENDRLSPFLMGNNERYLRDLPFLQEAHIAVKPVQGELDSVDVIVYTKDILSIGGSLVVRNTGSGRVEIKEDNFMGWGDRLEFQTLFDRTRNEHFGFGAQYIKRNILGTFIDGSAGYVNFNPAFSSRQNEETISYLRLVKPLVNPYMRWTYALTTEMHSTANMFNLDSVYHSALSYKYRAYDAWIGWNINHKHIGAANEFEKLRYLVSARVLDRQFLRKPLEFQNKYYYSFSDVTAVLASLSVFKLNFYKTRYIYGFGRKEDIPEGLEASFTTGWTKRDGRQRPYMALAFEKYYLTRKEGYVDCFFNLGSSLYQGKLQDVNLLARMDYFSGLYHLNSRWKQRNFFTVSFSRQFNPSLDEALYMESPFGLAEFKNNFTGGYMRATAKAESVFFSPWTLFFFKFAPFVFTSATLFQFAEQPASIFALEQPSNTRFYSALGGGIRTRNESLVFGTIELRAAYFPKKDAFNNSYIIQINTDLRFKYKQDFIKRPEFVQIN